MARWMITHVRRSPCLWIIPELFVTALSDTGSSLFFSGCINKSFHSPLFHTTDATMSDKPEPLFVDLNDNSKPAEIESMCMRCQENVRDNSIRFVSRLVQLTNICRSL